MRVLSSRPWLVGALLLTVIAAMLFFASRSTPEAPADRPAVNPKTSNASLAKSVPAPAAPLFGERLMENYGDSTRPPEEDLAAVARTLENYSLLVKGDNPLPLGANEEIASALRGRNRIGLRALPDQHPAINAQGQLVDRWGTPLFFHARSRDRLDIRSAGPDLQMWTADDLHRQPNGRFLRAPALLAPSLFEEEKDVR